MIIAKCFLDDTNVHIVGKLLGKHKKFMFRIGFKQHNLERGEKRNNV